MPKFNPKVAKGDKIRCLDARGASGLLEQGVVYTAAEDSRPGVRGEVVGLEEVASISWAVRRFEKVEQPKIIEDPSIDEPGILISAEAFEAMGAPISAEEPALKPGDWVRATGQVIKADGPGDILVEFFSHNEQWSGWIEEERVVKTAMPAWAAEVQCPAMTVNVLDTNVYYRCEKPDHRRFDDEHKSGKFHWFESDNSGFFEEA